MMSSEYNVFICHRGDDTKKNIVSVLQGILHSKGITCFVDYKMDEGTAVKSAIEQAIENSLVHIVILSEDFKGSRWCLNEVLQIMNIRNGITTISKPRKIIPIFYDVASSMDVHKPSVGTEEQKEAWIKALEGLLNLKCHEYNSETAFEWEELQHIVSEVEEFLISQYILPHQNRHHEGDCTWRTDVYPDYESVFICHYKKDTQRNVVSVLRGILRSRGITCVVADYEKEGAQTKLDIDKDVRNSRVYVIFLSKNFVTSKQCLEEIVTIMNVLSSEKPHKVKVLPVFLMWHPMWFAIS
ncbi:hypothetical protein KP509_16G033900 [Ceratopteris richardii]|uniref:ADP-ribosyl cyclase/cyclic ADP-ribose hydrolase n=1 Tax=Ceratopteris richardii TaxID=49495 RepID=A0A8T2T267_CERRI|nr:hypothetical protein KP509_1Z045900 [Ceratopteris richardii]KAH7387634.1 hypothetical protein KP509_16G033900 [Ceratopteris richardii]